MYIRISKISIYICVKQNNIMERKFKIFALKISERYFANQKYNKMPFTSAAVDARKYCDEMISRSGLKLGNSKRILFWQNVKSKIN